MTGTGVRRHPHAVDESAAASMNAFVMFVIFFLDITPSDEAYD
jgi:hypothetical protein